MSSNTKCNLPKEKIIIFSGASWSNGYGIRQRRQVSGAQLPPLDSFFFVNFQNRRERSRETKCFGKSYY